MNGWEEVQLKDVVSILGDGLHGTPEYSDDGEYYFVNGNNLSDGSIVITQETKRVSHSEYLKYKKELGDRTLFVSINGTIGNIAYYKGEKIVLGKSACYFNLLESVDKDFIRYTLSTEYFQKYAHTYANGTTIKNLGLKAMREFSFSLPPLQEQQQIAATLSCLDRKIENLRRQNETLEAIAQTLFKHWFIDFEFPNADGKPYKSSGGAMEPSELGDIPADWRVGSLGDVIKVNFESIGKGYPHKEIEYVDISSVGVGVLEGTTSYPLKKAPSRARRLVKHGDVIWSGVRPNRKSYLFIAHPLKNIVVSTGFITLTPDLIPSSYLYSWVTTDSFVEYLSLNASGSAYPAVKSEHFEIAEILLPDKFTLRKFHAVVDPMREKIYQNSRQIQTLTQTRDVLLPKLMSGKLRITS